MTSATKIGRLRESRTALYLLEERGKEREGNIFSCSKLHSSPNMALNSALPNLQRTAQKGILAKELLKIHPCVTGKKMKGSGKWLVHAFICKRLVVYLHSSTNIILGMYFRSDSQCSSGHILADGQSCLLCI